MGMHPLDLSDEILDTGNIAEAPNRITQELSELGDGIALIESFSHVVLLDTDDGFVAFDSSGSGTGAAVVSSLRSWSDKPVHTLVYTHGHNDHVGGSKHFAADAADHDRPLPRVVGHLKVNERLERYEATSGYNQIINARQFGGVPKSLSDGMGVGVSRSFLAEGTLRVDHSYDGVHTETVGGLELELHHAMGETDDHTWTWIPEKKMITAGDLFIWNFPNCGNPQKVQRYPLEWAAALREMASKGADLFVPAHGLPIRTPERIDQVLDTVATTLETLTHQVIDAMNTGATLDAIQSSVSVPEELLELAYMRPLYDEPEFVIRNIWRLYGGWWDGNPARLKPPSDAAMGREIAELAGGVEVLIGRAEAAAAAGDLRIACQLIEFAAAAEPESHQVHRTRSEIYGMRRKAESSLMAKGIFGSAKGESAQVLGETVERTRLRDAVADSLGKT